jgi:hypothetical protein
MTKLDYTPDPADTPERRERINATLDRLKPGIVRYVTKGILPGSFLRAMLTGNIQQVYQLADPDSLEAAPYLFGLLWECVPAQCWGAPNALIFWTRGGGFNEFRQNIANGEDTRDWEATINDWRYHEHAPAA